MDKIITIGREFGSGGHEIGMKLAEMLNIPFYDKELLKKVSDMGGLHESFLETHEEKAPQLLSASFERSLIDTYYQPTLSDTIFLEQSKVIKQIASEGPCVIVGRCSDYVLRDSNVFTVFVCASMEHKISRKYAVAPEKADYTDAQMEKYIKSIEKQRRKYYEHYTCRKWGDVSNYDLCINTDHIDVEGAAKVIITALENYK
ncbi:MAG: cytidylate kinase-like family protein [Firmicutes bacterium]|nr:cytidylate kinase-like family protein [Bacillota bacterium]MBQ2455821.1 cytidylate kinase-like family protein [Bacillota bacterium]MBQ3578337.1 cytidylate kinase-like family protein [Bacillota bacterium]MBQ4234778.1 cytidylate kinase-like family protein [Bacillota bacterium]MBQ6014292.1 cytidylate kinase-like family protein [Bacillota bacterium]